MLKIQYLTYANISKPYLKSNLAHISHTGLYLTYANISKPYLKSLFAHISHTISYLNTFSRQEDTVDHPLGHFQLENKGR